LALTENEQRARERLDAIQHIVVLMMENRSFDHTLGYLSLPDYADRKRPVNGLPVDPPYANTYRTPQSSASRCPQSSTS